MTDQNPTIERTSPGCVTETLTLSPTSGQTLTLAYEPSEGLPIVMTYADRFRSRYVIDDERVLDLIDESRTIAVDDFLALTDEPWSIELGDTFTVVYYTHEGATPPGYRVGQVIFDGEGGIFLSPGDA